MRPCVPCVSRVCPGSPRCLFTGTVLYFTGTGRVSKYRYSTVPRPGARDVDIAASMACVNVKSANWCFTRFDKCHDEYVADRCQATCNKCVVQTSHHNHSVSLASAAYYDEAGWRHWPKCDFQAIGPLDQLLLTLFGGRIEQIGRNCRIGAVSETHRFQCKCSAPLDLLGPNHTVVEIGANDGFHMSNSYFFDFFLGWRSLCVEANPLLFRQLKINRPRCTNINTLVALRSDFEQPDAVPYISIYPPIHHVEVSGSLNWQTGVSGIESPNASNLEIRNFTRAQHFARLNRLHAQRDFLPVKPFSAIFKERDIRTIDLLSVDVEGAEHSVLRSIDFSRVKIRTLVVEKPTDEIHKLLYGAGFNDIDIQTRLGDRIWHNTQWFKG